VAGYRVLIKPSAVKEIEAVGQKKDRQRIVSRTQSLAENARPYGCERLAASVDRYRVREGNYRVVYAVDDERLVVEVVKVGHRKEVYR